MHVRPDIAKASRFKEDSFALAKTGVRAPTPFGNA
jgi:hypothetical protein